MKANEPRGTIRFRESRGRFVVNYYDRAGARHQEGAKTKKEAAALLRLRLRQIRRGTFSPHLVIDRRNEQISDRFTKDRRDALRERMKRQNTEPGFRAAAQRGIDRSSTPESIAKKRKTFTTNLSKPGVKSRRLRHLINSTRSEGANASRSAIARSMHAQTGLSSDQVLSLLAAAKRARDRDWIVLLLMFWHRLKPEEVKNLSPRDLAGGSIVIPTGGSEALVSHRDPLLNELKAVENWLASGPSFLFFNSRKCLHRLIHKYASEAGLPKTLGHAHVLRNSIEARERLKGLPAERRHGPEKASAESTVWFRVGREIDALVSEGMSVEQARTTVADRHRYERETAVKYHKKFLRHLRRAPHSGQ